MKPEIRTLLEEIRLAIKEIDEFVVVNRGYAHYLSDRNSQLIAERLLIVIGEITTRIVKLDPEVPITATRQITAFRNRLMFLS